ncbi:MAG: ATP-binding protein [Candidatus Zapsychrus exili]|nr:ATP-binding protein [Candidatus Zapsychrus exili]
MKTIERKKLVSAFMESIRKGSLLVIGDPGTGKTWLLKQAIQKVSAEDIPHFFIQVDAIDVRSVTDFKKVLGLDNPIQDVLNYVSGGKRSILFIDALDTARGPVKQNIYIQFIELIQRKCKNWSIIASIRSYDAKHSLKLLNLFPIKSPELSEEFQLENVKYRHFFVPPLSGTEIAEFLDKNQLLSNLYQKASDKLKKLFYVPFNLWLLDTLISGDIALNRISDAQTVVQLFGLYWEFRIINKQDSEDRENILRRAAKIMVGNNSLSLWKKDLYIEGTSNTLKGLLSDQALIALSGTEQRLAFEHNMIFDYVVSRLLIQENPKYALSFLQQDQSRPIFLRPSIEYYFSRLWYSDRVLFWKVFWHFQSASKNEYIHILPIVTFVKEISCLEDFILVKDKLEKASSLYRKDYYKIINNIFRVLKVFKPSIEFPQDWVWVEMMYVVKDTLSVIFIDEFIRSLKTAVDKWDKWTVSQQEKIAVIARAILNWAWQPPKGLTNNQISLLHNMIAVWGVPLVCKTFGSGTKEAKKILSGILKRVGSSSFIIREIYSLCGEIDSIWLYDPDFVIAIYKTVFGYEEKSQGMTVMRGGILSLTSTKRQDYEGCYYILNKKFPNFLAQCPIQATKAMVEAVNIIVKRKELSKWKKKSYPIQWFQFFDIKAKYLEDRSSVWADREYRREHFKMLGDFTNYLDKLGQKNDVVSLNLIKSLLVEIARINEVAFIWKRLLRLCSKNPSVFTQLLLPLFKSTSILINRDTTYEAGEALRIGFVYLGKKDREEIENILLKLPEHIKGKNNKDRLTELRNTLLSCIPKDILSEVSKQTLNEAEKFAKIFPNEPEMKNIEFSSKPYTNIDWLKEQKANLEADSSKKILDLVAPIKSFQEKFLNGIPIKEEINGILRNVLELKKELENKDIAYDELVKQDVLTDLTSVCIRISRNDELSGESKILKLCEEVFVLAAKNQFPKYDKKYHDKFDSPHWGPSPRIEAAEGIMNLTKRKEFVTENNLKLIKDLSTDLVPAVRYNIIRRLHFLYRIAEKEMWNVAVHTAKRENTNGVLVALAVSMGVFARLKTNSVLDIFDIICKRKSIKERKASGVHNDPCVSAATQLVLLDSNKRSNLKIKVYEKSPLKYFDELQQVAISAINYLTIGFDEKEHKEINTELVRKRTRRILSRLLVSASDGFRKLYKRYGKNKWPEDRKTLAIGLYDIIDIIARWLYFSATSENRKTCLYDEQIQQYYFEIKSLINQIILVGSTKEAFLHPGTTHYLMQLCNIVIKYDPIGVIRITEALCKASEMHGYALDSMAIGEVVKLVEVYIADFKEILQDKRNILSLMNILNIFIKAGWPGAIKLAIRLDEIWR